MLSIARAPIFHSRLLAETQEELDANEATYDPVNQSRVDKG